MLRENDNFLENFSGGWNFLVTFGESWRTFHILANENFRFVQDKSYGIPIPVSNIGIKLFIVVDQVETWTYQNINSVFHNPDTLELSHEEKMELAKKQKIIKHDNTRLTKLPWKTDKQVRPSYDNYLAL